MTAANQHDGDEDDKHPSKAADAVAIGAAMLLVVVFVVSMLARCWQ